MPIPEELDGTAKAAESHDHYDEIRKITVDQLQEEIWTKVKDLPQFKYLTDAQRAEAYGKIPGLIYKSKGLIEAWQDWQKTFNNRESVSAWEALSASRKFALAVAPFQWQIAYEVYEILADWVNETYRTSTWDPYSTTSGAGHIPLRVDRRTGEIEPGLRFTSKTGNYHLEPNPNYPNQPYPVMIRVNDPDLRENEVRWKLYNSDRNLSSGGDASSSQTPLSSTSPSETSPTTQTIAVGSNIQYLNIDAVLENYQELVKNLATMEKQVEELKQEVENLRQKVLTLEQNYASKYQTDLDKGAKDPNSSGKNTNNTKTQYNPASTATAAKQEKEKANSLFEFIAESGEEAWAKVSASAKQHLQNVLHGTESFSHAFKSIWNEMVQEVKKLLLEKLYQAWLKPLLDGVVNWLSGMIGVRAEGGPVDAQTTYLVGEKGPELFVPNSSGTIIPNDRLAVGPAQNQPQPITVNVVNKTGVEASAKAETKFDGQRYVVDVFLDAYARNVGGMRDVLATRR